MPRKQNYSFQKREREASKVAKRAAKQAARDRKKDPEAEDDTDGDGGAVSIDAAAPVEVEQASP